MESIDSYICLRRYEQDAMLQIGVLADPPDMEPVMSHLMGRMRYFRDHPVSSDEMESCRDQAVHQMFDGISNQFADGTKDLHEAEDIDIVQWHLFTRTNALPPDVAFDRMMAVTPEDLHRLARSILRSPTICTMGIPATVIAPSEVRSQFERVVMQDPSS